jgi:predicted porin
VAATSAVFAQSSVTAYGRVDLSLARNVGSDTTVMQNGSGSRLGFRGTEDLGGGLKANFTIEHRFNADTGENPNARFWHGRSIVGLSGGFGTIQFGRDYTPAFLYSQLAADPWGWDTVANNAAATGGRIAPVRNDNAITYMWSGSGLVVGAQVALKENTEGATKNASSLVVRYANGPIMAALGHDRTMKGGKWTTVNGAYDLGAVKLGALIGTGTTDGGAADRKSYLLTAVAPMGAGELRFSVGELKNKTADVIESRQVGLGYHHSLSKRTTVYVDVVNNSKAPSNKTGVDFGIKHNF